MKFKRLVILIFIMVFMVGCTKKLDKKGVELNLKLLPDTLTDELYIKMLYEFDFSEEFLGFKSNYTLFVHFWRMKNKEMLFQDDHMPPTDTSKWKKGEPLKYSRVVFIPKFIDEFDMDFQEYEEVRLTVGLYLPGVPDSKIILYQKVLNIESVSLNAPEKIYDEGWYQLETNVRIKNPDRRKWRWTTKKAVCLIENPQKESILIIKGAVNKAKYDDQKVVFRINEKLLDEFIPESNIFSKKYIISPEQMGKESEFKLSIETNKTFIPITVDPNSKDNRELGIQIYSIYFREYIK